MSNKVFFFSCVQYVCHRKTEYKDESVDHSRAHPWLADSAPTLDSHTALICEACAQIFPRTKGCVCKSYAGGTLNQAQW